MHQAVDAQALALVAQRRFVDSGAHPGGIPSPRALARQDALGGVCRLLRCGGGDVEIVHQPCHTGRRPTRCTQMGERRAHDARLLQQLVHGFA